MATGEWKGNWSGKVNDFPGLESIVQHFSDFSEDVKEHILHIEDSIRSYFEKHPGKNGAVGVQGTTDPEGEHSATVTVAAWPGVAEAKAPEPDVKTVHTDDGTGREPEQQIEQPGGAVGEEQAEAAEPAEQHVAQPDPAPADFGNGATDPPPASPIPSANAPVAEKSDENDGAEGEQTPGGEAPPQQPAPEQGQAEQPAEG